MVGRGRERGRNHLDIATNSTDEISKKHNKLRKSALSLGSERAFSKLIIFGYFIVEFVAVSLGDGGGNVIYKFLEMMLSGNIAIQYMFCMLPMIKK